MGPSQSWMHAALGRQAERQAEQRGGNGQQDQRHGHRPRRFVDLGLDLRVDVALAVEGLAHQPEHVEAGHHRDDDADRPDPHEAVLEARAEDLVLAEEAGQGRDAGQRDRADEHRPVGDRDLAPQGAHPVHVLLFVDGMDDRARAQEEQALEEAVRHQVEDRRGVGADAEAGEHVAQLAERRIRQHALDVALGEGDRCGEDGGEDADCRHQDHRLWRVGEDRVGAGDEVDAGVDHRRGMDQRADRRRAFHGVGQPDVERELGALAHRAHEQQQRDAGHHPRLYRAALQRRGQQRSNDARGEVERADGRPDRGDAERKAEVADAVDEERLLGRQCRRAAAVPEADQQVARQADQLPGREQQQEVVGQDQQQHAEHEQVEVGEEAPAARVVGHVADRVDVDEHADRRHHDQQHRGQRVDGKVGGDLEAARRYPGVQREVQPLVAEGVREERLVDQVHRDQPGGHDRRHGDQPGAREQAPADERGQAEARQRQCQQQQDEDLVGGHSGRCYSRIREYSSTSGVRRLR